MKKTLALLLAVLMLVSVLSACGTMDKPETQEFIVKLKDYCDFVFSQYEKQNKSHMIVAIGCTGGQHRSVSICNWLYDEYKDTYRCFKSHRDIGVDEE